MTGLIYVGCEPYGFDNFSLLLPRNSVVWQDANANLKQLRNGDPGRWRYPENLRKRWRAEDERRVAVAASTQLTKYLLPSTEERLHGRRPVVGHLGLIVDLVGRTVRRDDRPNMDEVVFFAGTKFWPVFKAIYGAGPSGITAEAAYGLYDGSPEDCHSIGSLTTAGRN